MTVIFFTKYCANFKGFSPFKGELSGWSISTVVLYYKVVMCPFFIEHPTFPVVKQ